MFDEIDKIIESVFKAYFIMIFMSYMFGIAVCYLYDEIFAFFIGGDFELIRIIVYNILLLGSMKIFITEWKKLNKCN